MARKPRELRPECCYHVTVRCNNRDFRLQHPDHRRVVLFALARAQGKFGYHLYGLCIMSNHLHLLLKPELPEQLPQVMHWLNWYMAMTFNRLLGRCGHFWEKRYHSSAIAQSDGRRVLNTLRYLHGNPKAAGIRRGFFYDWSNYGVYDRLSHDGLTQWHPEFLQLGPDLEACARRYREFCSRYRGRERDARRPACSWGRRLLLTSLRRRGRKPQEPRGQLRLPGLSLDPGDSAWWLRVLAVSERFRQANRAPLTAGL